MTPYRQSPPRALRFPKAREFKTVGAFGDLIIAACVASFVSMILFVGCSGTQHPRSWDANAHIAVNSAAHALRAIDTGLATRYERLAPTIPDAQLAAFETPYQRALSAERLALDSLITAERDINEAVAHPTDSARCVAGQSVERAKALVADAIDVARSFGLAIDAATVATIQSLETIAAALVPTCGSGAP